MDGNYYNPIDEQFGDPRPSRRLVIVMSILTAIIIVTTVIIWLVWYRPYGVGFASYLALIFQWIIGVLTWPIRTLLQALGLWRTTDNTNLGILTPMLPNAPLATKTEVIKHEISQCPPCNCNCECPECKETDTKPFELEIKYLKDMMRMTGAIARRENAINAQYRELYPGFSVITPSVQKLSEEYNIIKNQIKKDDDEWQYFKNYFTRLSGIPSDSQKDIQI